MILINQYIETLDGDRKVAFEKIWKSLITKTPKGFDFCLNYKMPSVVVSHKLYPKGYHCDTTLPLPFISLASQKNFIALYHMGLYASPQLLDWFVSEYPKHSKAKLDMGKSCIRFKKMDDIPFKLIEELASKMSVKEWIDLYESNFIKNKDK